MAANTQRFHLQLGNQLLKPQVTVLPDQEKVLALADLLSVHPTTAPRALQTLTELARQNPNNPLIEEKLGYAAWNMSKMDDARSYFARAVEHGSRNSEMIYRYAIMQKQVGAPDQELIHLFEQVLEVLPDFDDARFQLGLLEFNRKRFSTAAQLLSKLRVVKDDWAYAYNSVMAYCNMEFSHIEEAKLFGEKASLDARTPGEQSQAEHLLAYLQIRTSATHRATVLASAEHQQTGEKGAQSF